jgi:uncharacterized protein YndB with AHSA1/START domain
MVSPRGFPRKRSGHEPVRTDLGFLPVVLEGSTCPEVTLDPRVGGTYRIAMQPPDGELFHLAGKYLEVEPPTRLAYTFQWEPLDPDDRETVARIALRERDGAERGRTHPWPLRDRGATPIARGRMG